MKAYLWEGAVREYFSELFGNEKTKARIGAAIENGTLPHAFLISGPDGSGKMTLALELAAALNCEGEEGAPLPCHRCNACRRIKAGEFTDLKVLNKPKDKMTIGVSEIRLFREDMFLSSTESDYKIYVIDEAERMTPNAQNALLKVLEEPPERVVIIMLVASDDAILTTIKSRAQYIAMERFGEDSLLDYFKKHATNFSLSDSEKTRELLLCADGRIGRARELVSGGADEVRAARELTAQIINALSPSAPYSQLYEATKGLPTKKDELIEALEGVQIALRDLMLLKYDDNAPLLFYTSRDEAKRAAEGLKTRRLAKIYDALCECLEDVIKNASVAATVASLGARIKLIK